MTSSPPARELLQPSTRLSRGSLDPQINTLVDASESLSQLASSMQMVAKGLAAPTSDPERAKETVLKLLRVAAHDLIMLIEDLEDVRLPR